MDFTGRPMKGFVFVGPEGTKTKKDLEYWINLARRFQQESKELKEEKVMSASACYSSKQNNLFCLLINS